MYSVKKILLVNAYSYRNLGDSGIVISMVQFLEETFPDCEISLMSSDYIDNDKFYSAYGVKCVPAPWPLNPKNSLIRKYLNGLFVLFLSKVNIKNKIFNEFGQADIIISVGGGYLYSSRKGPLGIGLMNSLFNYWVSKKLCKYVIGFPQSLGPFNYYLDKQISKYVLKKIDRIYVRETYSSDMHKYLNNSVVQPDIALNFKCNNIDDNKNDSGHVFIVGITVLNWLFANANANEHSLDIYIDKLVSTVITLSETRNIFVNVYPQVQVGGSDSDLIISERLVTELKVKGLNAQIKDISNFNHQEIIQEYGLCDLFLASRMHSAIFAIDAGVPTVALAYQPKTKGTMEAAGLFEQSVDIDEFTVASLQAAINKALLVECKYVYPSDFLKSDILNLIK